MSDSEVTSGNRIRLLPIHVSNQIAAGEVVERPASVVKELMENAVDADANSIDVVVTAGGRKLIAITDDGIGMNRDDALMSIERQATSKIHDVDDIEAIHTLGFRGEALASIASVSRFSLKSCPRGETCGTDLVVTGGRIQDVRDIGGPAGTVIEIRDLFFNVPARRKFLRAYQTEQAHIRSGFSVQALAHPGVAMSLTVDGRDVHRLPPCEKLRDRVRDLMGRDLLQHLCDVPETALNSVKVTGFVARPTYTRSDRAEQFVFINGRPATAPVLFYAIREAYPKLDKDRKPVVLLFLEMPPELVDVNVHPTKREVRFRRSRDVRDAVMNAVRAALGMAEGPEAEVAVEPARPETPASVPPVPPVPVAVPRVDPQRDLPLKQSPQGGMLDRRPDYPEPHESQPEGPGRSPAAAIPPSAERIMASDDSGGGSPWAWCRLLGQVADRYALLETDGGYVVLDPRAAHERVLFEKLMHQLRDHSVESQRLLLPETAELSPRDAMRLRKHLDSMGAMGFGVDTFGGDTFVVDALPACVADCGCRQLLIDVVHGLEVAGSRRGRERWREEAIARAASASAVSRRDKISDAEIDVLVADLVKTDMPYTCPRGKPTMIFTSMRELNRKFGRE